jgi:hypothetical protein
MTTERRKVGRPFVDPAKKLVGVKVMLPPDLAEWARLNKCRVNKHKLLAAELEKLRSVLALSVEP